MYNRPAPEPKEFEEKMVQINRISKKTKGGNKMRFAALMVIGNRKGQVGVGLGKAADVSTAMKKGVHAASKQLFTVPMKGTTIPHEVRVKFGASRILLKPAPEGSGVIAGGSIRAVVEAAGVRDVVGKILGTNNKIGNVYATVAALKMLKMRS